MIKKTFDELVAKLPYPRTDKWVNGVWFEEVFKKGDFSLELYAPKGVDLQTPHEQDEIYIIVQGRGELVLGGEVLIFEKGDVFFVPAGVVHRFENFSEDFSTWVIFFGDRKKV